MRMRKTIEMELIKHHHQHDHEEELAARSLSFAGDVSTMATMKTTRRMLGPEPTPDNDVDSDDPSSPDQHHADMSGILLLLGLFLFL